MSDYRLVEAEVAGYELPELTRLGLQHRFLLKPLNFRPVAFDQSVTQVATHFLPQNMPLVTGQQVHSANVAEVAVQDLASVTIIPDTDGTLTQQVGVALLAKYADCIPILLYDPVKKVHASVHSGWRGTLQGIGQKALQQMMDLYGCQPQNIRVGYGPAIGFEDFEVTAEVYQQFWAYASDIPQAFRQKDATHWLIDTKQINKVRFEQMGISAQHQYDVAVSTVQDPKCHSYRRDQADFGLMAVVSYME